MRQVITILAVLQRDIVRGPQRCGRSRPRSCWCRSSSEVGRRGTVDGVVAHPSSLEDPIRQCVDDGNEEEEAEIGGQSGRVICEDES